MARNRHDPAGSGTDAIPEAAIGVRTLGLRMPAGYRIPPHAHEWHQLVYATEGVMTVETPGGAWVVPSERAVWIPAGCEHAVAMTVTTHMRTTYVRPDLAAELPTRCFVLPIPGLLRELVLEVARLQMLSVDVASHRHLTAVLLDQITVTREAALVLGLPTDPRARRVADRARADLAAVPTLAELARGCGASARTIERLFRRETGATFGRWLQRARALHALQRLAAGDSVTMAGLAVGYDSTSAFIAMFKRVIGTTPGSWIAGAAPAESERAG
ncbi:MAG: helix-turn-helix transcriptional regulator [Planctomycetota bacterium]